MWREYQDRLLGFMVGRVGNTADAADILQEVMLRMHWHGDEFAHVDPVSGWVYRIAANAIADSNRRGAVTGFGSVRDCRDCAPRTLVTGRG